MVTTRSATGSLPPPKLRTLRDAEDELEDEREQLHEVLYRPLKRWRESGEAPEKLVDDRPEWMHDSVMSSFSSRICKAVRCQKSKAKTEEGEDTRTTKKKRRLNGKNNGRLTLLFTMPLDIICEVASYLDPLDVLHLARSGRDIRNFLLSKVSKPVWRAARNRIGLPDCPRDLSEPQYASLVFETDCNVCGAPNIKRIDYTLRVRLCRGCFRENVVRGSELVKELPKIFSCDWLLFILVPFFDFWVGYDASNRLVTIDYLQQRYFKPDFMEIANIYMRLSGCADRQAHFVVQRVKTNICAAINAKALGVWQDAIERKKLVEESIRSAKRREQILTRLTECGFTNEQYPRGRDNLAHRWMMTLSSTHEITNRNWKRLRPQLEEMIANTAAERIEKARKARLNRRYKELRTFYIAYLVDLETNIVEREKYWWLLTNPGAREGGEETEKAWDECRRLERLTLPNFGDLRSMALVQHLLEEEDVQLTFTESKWDIVRDVLPDEATRFYQRMLDSYGTSVDTVRRKRDEDRSSAVKTEGPLLTFTSARKGKAKALESGSDDTTVPAALRASSFFFCSRISFCRSPANPFPNALGGRHTCGIGGEHNPEPWNHIGEFEIGVHHLNNVANANADQTAGAGEPSWASWQRYKPTCPPWRADSQRCSVEAMGIAESLLTDLGLSAEKTRMSDMMELGKVFECCRCLGGEAMDWCALITHYHNEISWNTKAQLKLEAYNLRRREIIQTLLPAPEIINTHAIPSIHSTPPPTMTPGQRLVRFLPLSVSNSVPQQTIGSFVGSSSMATQVNSVTTVSSERQNLLAALTGVITYDKDTRCSVEIVPKKEPNAESLLTVILEDWVMHNIFPDDNLLDEDHSEIKEFILYEPDFLMTETNSALRCALCHRIGLMMPNVNGKKLGRHIYSIHGKVPKREDVLGLLPDIAL